MPPLTSMSNSTCSNSFVHSNILTSKVKPSIVQSRNTELGERSDMILGTSKQTGADCRKIDETKMCTALTSSRAWESKPLVPLVDARPESNRVSSSVAPKTVNVNFTDISHSSVNMENSSNSELGGRNSNIIDKSPPNLEVIARISSLNENITDAAHISTQNNSLSSFEKDSTNALTAESSVLVAMAVYNDSIVIPHSSNLSPFLPSIHCSEFYSASNQENLPSSWDSYNTYNIPSVLHKRDQESENSLTISDFEENKINLERVLKGHKVSSVDDLDNCSNTEATELATENILASLLARIVPNQTHTDYSDRSRYLYHLFRKASSPLEKNEQNLLKNSGYIDSEWSEKKFDSVTPITFEADTDRDENELGLDDDSRRSTSCGLNDDGSLTDLEDYLFYCPTDNPSLPFVSTDYQSYSNCTIHSSCGVNNWHYGSSCGTLQTVINGFHNVNQAEYSAWHQECDKLAEKVKRLKTQMENVRLRKQSRFQNAQTTEYPICKEENSAKDQSHDITNWEKNSKQVTAESCNLSWTNTQTNRNHLSHLTSSLSCLKDASHFPKYIVNRSLQTDTKNRNHQRRNATVTPPDVNRLITTADPQINDSEPTSTILPSLPYSERISRSLEGDIFENSLCLEPSKSITQPSSPNGNLTTLVSDSSPKESVLCSASVNQLHPVNFQDNKSTKPDSSSHSTSIRNRSITMKTPSSSASFFPSLGSSVLTGQPATIIPTRLPSRRDSELNTAVHFRRPGNCDKKLPNPTPPYRISTGLTEESRSPSSPNSIRLKRCSMCLRKIGLTNSYTCRCDRSFCSLHRYAEVHACQYDYKSEARRYIIESNPVVTAPKLPKI
ncbi:unnamed protein product [Schistosoma turkestanicum]|nr:unnamed protein product [Schistosoma turkestanicum]